MRVVIDTNVVVSRFLSSRGAPARILELGEQGDFTFIVSEEILAEYIKALGYSEVRSRHGMKREQLNNWIDGLRLYVETIETNKIPSAVPGDPKDNKFIECAVAGGADYIVSGDRHLLNLQEYSGIQILPPAAFLLVLEQG